MRETEQMIQWELYRIMQKLDILYGDMIVLLHDGFHGNQQLLLDTIQQEFGSTNFKSVVQAMLEESKNEQLNFVGRCWQKQGHLEMHFSGFPKITPHTVSGGHNGDTKL